MRRLALHTSLRRCLFFALALAALPSTSWALDPTRAVKDYRVTEWGQAAGLPYPSVAALGQSSDGYIWIGTRAGLGRFDGVAFTTFNTANVPELGDDRILSLCTTHDGTLWIGTARGVTWYRNGVWTRAHLHPDLDNVEVVAICERPDGRVFIAHSVDRAMGRARATGVFCYSGGQCTEIKLQNGAYFPGIDRIAVMPNGDSVFSGIGIVRGRGDIFTDESRLLGPSAPRAQGLATAPNGAIWIGTRLSLTEWTDAGIRSFTTADGLPSNSIRSLMFDRDANLWVGTSNGLSRYANGKFESLLLHGVEPLSNVIAILEDAERNLWVGTDNGLVRVQDVKATTFGLRDGLPVNPILCLLEARDGTHWVGTIGGGLVHLTPARIKTLNMAGGLKEDSIGALAEGADGAIWIGYYTRGIGRYLNGKLTYYAPGEPVRVRGLAIDSKGAVWAASSDGLFKFTDGKFERVAIDPALEFPRALYIDRNDTVWIAAGMAFGSLRDGKWSVHRKPAELNLQSYQNFFGDSAGGVWLLQDGPIVHRIRDDRVEQFTFPGLGPLVYSGFEYKGEVWINFRTGVGRIPLAEFDAVSAGKKKVPAYTLFSDDDGMRSRAPNNSGAPGAIVTRDGVLWFSTSMGIAQIKPENIRVNRLPPNVVIERVLADKIEYRGKQLDAVPPGRGELAIHFTALSFVNPGEVRFKYRLRGFDADWIDAGTARVAYYGGLRPGRYEFDVIACNNEGVWNETGAHCAFVLQPHFYQQWWFFTLAGLAVSGGGVGAYGWRSRRLKRRARELEAQNDELERRIGERTLELRRSYEALRASEYFYHSLVESLPHAIVRKDAAGRYTYGNGVAAEIFGRPLTEIIGRTDDELFPPDIARKNKADDERILEQRQSIECEEIVERDGIPKRYLHVKRVPLFDEANHPLGVQVLFWDMTGFRETESKLKNAQRELIEVSRLAGIAEMATGVLHNLGNAVNSVKVACTVARDKVRRSDVGRIQRIANMLAAEKDRLPEFFATDPRASKLPPYLSLLAQQFGTEHGEILNELQQIGAGIEHLSQIIAAQQAGARVGGVVETVPPKELVEYACRINQALLDRHKVEVVREIMPAPEIAVDRQKVVQILGNLVRNAIEAMVEVGHADKRLTVAVRPATDGAVLISVADNGGGIAPEHLARIFEFGFTTKPTGHGFGLHNSAVAAHEIGGALRADSEGRGRGATFTLTLPLKPPGR